MQTVDVTTFEADSIALIHKAARGEGFVISENGQPLVNVTPAVGSTLLLRTGFMAGQIEVPADFNTMGSTEIEELFNGGNR